MINYSTALEAIRKLGRRSSDLTRRLARACNRRTPCPSKLAEMSQIIPPRGGMHYVDHMGIKVPVPPDIVSCKILDSIKSGSYEAREAEALRKIIRPGERILELGGGLGFIASIAGKNPNTEAILVFEANPRLGPVISAALKANGVTNAQIQSGVLSKSKKGLANFYCRKDFWSSSLSPQKDDIDVEIVQVPVFKLHDIIRWFVPTLIICDIEGGEDDLFNRVRLPGVRQILIEMHQGVIGRQGMKRVFDNFSAAGFHYEQRYSCRSIVLFSRVT